MKYYHEKTGEAVHTEINSVEDEKNLDKIKDKLRKLERQLHQYKNAVEKLEKETNQLKDWIFKLLFELI